MLVYQRVLNNLPRDLCFIQAATKTSPRLRSWPVLPNSGDISRPRLGNGFGFGETIPREALFQVSDILNSHIADIF